MPKRFRIAFSFAGEKRQFVEQVAHILAKRFGEEKILYDKFHEAEFARCDLGIHLPKLYGEESDLIVPVLSPDYDVKRWTGWEWMHIYGLLTKTDAKRVMPSRFAFAQADGLSPAAGFIELDHKTPEEFTTLILERLALNEGKAKDSYTRPASREPPHTSIPHNLPALQPFFGRQAELRKIAEALDPKYRGWGTLIDGDGGRGKTSLAVYAAYQVPPEHFERIVFVSIKQRQQDDARSRSLGGFALASWMEMLSEIARILDLKAVMQAAESRRAQILKQCLDGRRILFLLDNLETLDDAEQDQLFAFLDFLPSGNKALLTSRRFVGNSIQALDLPVLDEATALQLLREIAAHNTAFASSSDADRIELIRQTQGNALLLRWTAGQVGRGKCRNVADALKHLRACPKDNNPLGFIFDDVVASLDEPDIAILASLAHVSQSMRREDVVAVSGVIEGDVLPRLKELINRAFVTVDAAEAYFAVVALVADFVRVVKPAVMEETGDRLEKHAYLLVVENGDQKHEHFSILVAAWPVIAAALPRFLVGENARLQTVCNALRKFLDFTGRWDERFALAREAEYRAVSAGDFYNAGWRAYQIGWTHYLRRQANEVLACASRAEAHWSAAQAGARERAYAIRLRGNGHQVAKDFTSAIDAYRRAVELWRSLGSEHKDVAVGLMDLAGAEQLSGDLDAARRDFLEAQRINRIVDNLEGIAIVTGNLADIELDCENWKAAEALAREALPLSEKVGRVQLVATNSYRLGAALVKQGKKDEGLPHIQSALEIFELLRSPHVAAAKELIAECASSP